MIADGVLKGAGELSGAEVIFGEAEDFGWARMDSCGSAECAAAGEEGAAEEAADGDEDWKFSHENCCSFPGDGRIWPACAITDRRNGKMHPGVNRYPRVCFLQNGPRMPDLQPPGVVKPDTIVLYRQRNRCSLDLWIQRKVRAPQDMVVGNAHRPRGSGKCNRKQTAERRCDGMFIALRRGKGETVR